MFREILNEKIGNILLYFSKNIKELYLTKALKLLYILDETAVKETGSPITWLDYKVWELGPVPETIYDELYALKNRKETCNPLFSFVNVVDTPNPHGTERKCSFIEAKAAANFNEMIFSDYEIDLLDRVIKENKDKSGRQLVDELHSEGTLYHEVEKTIIDLPQIFILNEGKSNISIEFSKLLKDDPLKQEVYKSASSSLNFQRAIANS